MILSTLKRIFIHWRTTSEGLGFASIGYLLTGNGAQISIPRTGQLIPTLILAALSLYKLFATDPVSKPAPTKPDPVIGSEIRNLSFLVPLMFALSASAIAQVVEVRHAANFRHAVASGSIAVAFAPAGEDFTTTTESAEHLPLPPTLARVRVLADRTFAGLFFVSPRQINFLLPLGLAPGQHAITVVTPDGRNLTGTFHVALSAPGVFTRLGNGQGEAAANYLRFDGAGCIVLWATGITTSKASLFLNGREVPAQYVGYSQDLVGTSQMNFVLPISELSVFPAGAFVRVYYRTESGAEVYFDSNGFTVHFQ